MSILTAIIITLIGSASSAETHMITETPTEVLNYTPPDGVVMAKNPCTIDFGIIRNTEDYGTDLGCWANVTRDTNGNFYTVLGNHNESEGGTNECLLVKYNPVAKLDSILLSAKDPNVLGDVGDGKWHGYSNIDPQGNMYLLGFYYGDMIRYNVYTGDYTVYDDPATDTTNPGGYPLYYWDYERGRIVALCQEGKPSQKGKVMIYDTNINELIFYGNPLGEEVYNRGLFLDWNTGDVYYTQEKEPHKIIKYDYSAGNFVYTNTDIKFRIVTERRNSEGAYYMMTYGGDIYLYYPDTDTSKYVGKNYGTDDGFYTAQIAMSPSERYLYYVCSSNDGDDIGFPVVQYNTQTNTPKVLGYLYDYYSDKHDYKIRKSYGIALNADGSQLFISMNGYLDDDRRHSTFVMHIPESERLGDNPVDNPYIIHASKPLPTDTPTPTPGPTDTPTPTTEPTNTPTPTLSPTNSLTPTLSPTNTPTPTNSTTPGFFNTIVDIVIWILFLLAILHLSLNAYILYKKRKKN